MGWQEAADLNRTAYERTVSEKIVTYDCCPRDARAQEVKTSDSQRRIKNNI